MAGERSDLGKIFITPGGDYDATVTYETLTMVKYNNSLYLTLRTVTGVTPSDDRVNYLLMAQGFTATRLESITATDVQGLVTEPGDEMPAQTLINAIADRVANQLVTNSALTDILGDYILKSAIANNLSITEEGKVLDARQGKALNDALAERDVHTPMNTVTILSNANQLTRSALATLPTGCYIVQCASTTDFAVASAYGVLFHYGSLANYHHYLFTNGEGLWKLTYSGTTQGEWQSVRPAYMDASLTLTAVGGAVQLSSATGYVVSYNKFISGTVIDSNNINVRFHTYNNLIYAKFYTDTGNNAPTGTYKVRCWYMP